MKKPKPSTSCDVNNTLTSTSTSACETPSTSNNDFESDYFNFDLGEWIGKSSRMSRAQKLEMLKRCWVPTQGYNFREDSNDKKRSFIYSWLETYKP